LHRRYTYFLYPVVAGVVPGVVEGSVPGTVVTGDVSGVVVAGEVTGVVVAGEVTGVVAGTVVAEDEPCARLGRFNHHNPLISMQVMASLFVAVRAVE
jgi:hypothetical protein